MTVASVVGRAQTALPCLGKTEGLGLPTARLAEGCCCPAAGTGGERVSRTAWEAGVGLGSWLIWLRTWPHAVGVSLPFAPASCGPAQGSHCLPAACVRCLSVLSTKQKTKRTCFLCLGCPKSVQQSEWALWSAFPLRSALAGHPGAWAGRKEHVPGWGTQTWA